MTGLARATDIHDGQGGHGRIQELSVGRHDACGMSLDPVVQGYLEGLWSENSSALPGLWDPGGCQATAVPGTIVWELVPLAAPASGQPAARTHSREHLVCIS